MLVLATLAAVAAEPPSTPTFRCYQGTGSKLAISVAHGSDPTVASLTYRGQTEPIALKRVSDETTPDALPTTTSVYSELVDGKQTGTYTMKRFGVHESVTYVRARDGKTFSFEFDLDLSIVDGEERTTPCYR